MTQERIDNIRRLIGFDASDCEVLVEVQPRMVSAIPAVVERFYAAILSDGEARAVFGADTAKLERLRFALAAWLEQLFTGTYDNRHFHRRAEVGRTHVRVALPQHLMIAGMEIIRQGFAAAADNLSPEARGRGMRSLNKLLALELCVMLDSYQDSYAIQIREDEHLLVEERLTRAEHLAEIGQLAASLAHEIKNPLAGISGAIQIIQEGMPESNPHRPIIGEILEQISRLDAAVKDLLLYARPNQPKIRACELDAVIRRVLSVLRSEPALAGMHVDDSAVAVGTMAMADEGQLEQLLINLILNSAQASVGSGAIRVKASAGAESVGLVIADAGKGMDAETCRRAFEPFFTTKAKGTGLGLSICRRIVEGHEGRISIESELGKGTTVTVVLPRRLPEGSNRPTVKQSVP